MDRLDQIFDSGNPVMRFLTLLVDLAILNIMTVICVVPVVTAGGALAAMNYVMLHLCRRDETYVTRMFRQSLKSNLKQGIPEGLAVLLVALIAAVDLWALHGSGSRTVTLLMIIITVFAGYLLSASVYVFALQSRYENTVRETILNGLRLSAARLPRTVCMMLIWAVWIAFLVYLHKAAPLIFLIYGFTLPGYLCTILYNRIFEELETEE